MAAKKIYFPFDSMIKTPSMEDRTVLIYYGGKSRDADWIISHFPPAWRTLVDVFGGGGAISFRVGVRDKVVIYNDIGNVYNFMKVMREQGDELYRQLYFTEYGRDQFEKDGIQWREAMERGDELEWARRWYTCINQGYTHEETSTSWHKAIVVNSARAISNHTDDLPGFVNRIRKHLHIENMDFAQIIPEYDKPTTLFYCDPPYLHDTRADKENYLNEMTPERHKELLLMLNQVEGQVVLSGYDSDLYNSLTADWRTVTKTAKSSIQNRSSVGTRGDRTEKLWIKEHNYGLWGQA
jgi:DNA adenine methylase